MVCPSDTGCFFLSIAYPLPNGNRKSCFTFRPDFAIITPAEYAPVAQLDRVTDSDSVGQRFESARAYHKKPAVRQVFCCAPRIRGLSPRREIRSGVPQKNPVVSIATGFFFAIAAVKNQAQFRLFSAIKCPVMLHQKLTSPGSEMHRPQGFAGLEESRCSRRRQRLLHPRAYPSATSSVIITLKPTAKKTVPRLECFPWDISGISSSTTT